MPFRKLRYRMTYHVANDVEVRKADFKSVGQALTRVVHLFNARHTGRFTCQADLEGVRIGPFSLAAETTHIVIPRQHRHSASMRRLQKVADSTRIKLRKCQQDLALADGSDAHRRITAERRKLEGSCYDILKHDFSRIHTTHLFSRSRATERLLLRCILYTLAKKLPQLELDFTESTNPDGIQSLHDASQNVPHSPYVELQACEYAQSRSQCRRDRCTWNASRHRCTSRQQPQTLPDVRAGAGAGGTRTRRRRRRQGNDQ